MASVFRKIALERLSSPDRLDSMLRITSPMSWIGIAAAALLTVGVVVWSFAGQIPSTVNSYGFLTYDYGVNTLYNTAAGQVDSLLVQPGDAVEVGTPVAEIIGPTGQSVVVEADQSGVIREVLAAPGASVIPNQGLFRLSPHSSSPLLLVCYVEKETALQLEPGMDVAIYPENASSDCGRMEGQVACVDRVHASEEAMAAVVGDDPQTIATLLQYGSVVAVTCTLREDSSTASGYFFSGPAGGDMTVYGGLPAAVQITLGQTAPIAMVFPMLGGGGA